MMHPKFLGGVLDSKLRKQLNRIEEKCEDRISVLKALSFGQFNLPNNVLRSLYKSLIRPLMEYSCFMEISLSGREMKQLQVIQNKSQRITCGKTMWTHTKIEELHKYSISNEFRPFASPYRTLTVTVPYPHRHRTVPYRTVLHRTSPYPPFLSFLRPKSVKNGGYGTVTVRYAEVRYGDGGFTVR